MWHILIGGSKSKSLQQVLIEFNLQKHYMQDYPQILAKLPYDELNWLGA